MQCALRPSICEVGDPLGLFLPAVGDNNIDNDNNINNNKNNNNSNNQHIIDSNTINPPDSKQWIEIIEPALKILEISDPNPAIVDPGKDEDGGRLPVADSGLHMKPKNGFQHRKRVEQTRMNKHKRRKRMRKDRIQIHEVYAIRRAKKLRKREKMKKELVEKFEQLALVNPKYAELKKNRTYIKYRLEEW